MFNGIIVLPVLVADSKVLMVTHPQEEVKEFAETKVQALCICVSYCGGVAGILRKCRHRKGVN